MNIAIACKSAWFLIVCLSFANAGYAMTWQELVKHVKAEEGTYNAPYDEIFTSMQVTYDDEQYSLQQFARALQIADETADTKEIRAILSIVLYKCYVDVKGNHAPGNEIEIWVNNQFSLDKAAAILKGLNLLLYKTTEGLETFESFKRGTGY